jgi:cell division protein ZipA
MPPEESPASESAASVPDEIIAINIFARDGRILSGPDILNVAMQLGLNYGDMGFFHSLDDDGDVIFTMANAFKPGSFDIADMEALATRGLALFMSLPCKADPLDNFDAMLSVARDMATQLHAQLHDETRSALTRQGIEAIRLRINEYKLKAMRGADSA